MMVTATLSPTATQCVPHPPPHSASRPLAHNTTTTFPINQFQTAPFPCSSTPPILPYSPTLDLTTSASRTSTDDVASKEVHTVIKKSVPAAKCGNAPSFVVAIDKSSRNRVHFFRERKVYCV
ncbi:hypothetical protein RIF29_12546 [Crotalaria pallida]|uniref:Uncharacterized protein n=1 Tax=Crotalaria pallida TaxID=3830 RepID=A0AAN9IN82_CROPI